jgi:hypothetical protein
MNVEGAKAPARPPRAGILGRRSLVVRAALTLASCDIYF